MVVNLCKVVSFRNIPMVPIVHTVVYMGVGIVFPVIPTVFALGILLCKSNTAGISWRLALEELIKPLALSLCLPLVLTTGLVIISHIVQVGVVGPLLTSLIIRIY